jgi:hypothetical protein
MDLLAADNSEFAAVGHSKQGVVHNSESLVVDNNHSVLADNSLADNHYDDDDVHDAPIPNQIVYHQNQHEITVKTKSSPLKKVFFSLSYSFG